ncbi:MAG: hypothetical protein CVV64_16615 [Candidatus Wallbacteria bacterium HGW-Wallbacteria-1]|jgi:hypothetical protein|uniref:Uncharacterized protein n=1 Tax=Candidatus Wallbacteria bacterium HGW-Wallbacteria-1 TaxID=2013854 RepID=A0A2N1PKY7_9BACT|nr:MAG: hypothetical protein CVV64_16615 [Candidatus Wallbacteria bacterium HGW-Wallbacteria-1]
MYKKFIFIAKQTLLMLILGCVFWVCIYKIVFVATTTDSEANFKNCTFKISSNKSEYCHGETIEMSLVIEADSEREIVLFDNMEHSFFLECYNLESKNVSLIKPRSKKNRHTVKIDKHSPYNFKIYGGINFDIENRNYILIFSQLNKKFIISKSNERTKVVLRGCWRPVKPGAMYSFEDFTNCLEFTLQD